MSIPSLAELSVVLDPTSSESGSDVRIVDAVRDLWRERRLKRHIRRAFDPAVRPGEIAAGRPPRLHRLWTGDVAQPGR